MDVDMAMRQSNYSLEIFDFNGKQFASPTPKVGGQKSHKHTLLTSCRQKKIASPIVQFEFAS